MKSIEKRKEKKFLIFINSLHIIIILFKSNRTKLNIMNADEPPRPKGISTNREAPQINTVDIYDNPINLSKFLNEFNGVLIDFFRGNW